MKYRSILSALALSILLAACGGGGGGSAAPELTQPEPVDVVLGNVTPAQTSTNSSNGGSPSTVARSGLTPAINATTSSSSSAAYLGGSVRANKKKDAGYSTPTLLPQEAPQPIAQMIPSRVLPDQKTPLSLTTAQMILTMAADPQYNPTAYTDILRLASAAERFTQWRDTAMVSGSREDYLKAVKGLCEYEAFRTFTGWAMTTGQHATVAEQQARGLQRGAEMQDCQTAGETLTDAELATAAAGEIRTPVPTSLDLNPVPVKPSAAPTPDFQTSAAFDSEKEDAMGRIQSHLDAVNRADYRGDVIAQRRSTIIADIMLQQLDAWRNSFTYAEVRSKIDRINALGQTRLMGVK